MKNRNATCRILLLIVAGVVSLIFALALRPYMTEATPPTAREQLTRAWRQAGDIGQYRYRTTVAQTHHPTLRLENVGRTARTERFVIKGAMDTPAERMTLQLTAADNPPLQVKIEDGRGYGRLHDSDPWTEMDIATDLFAPGGDPMGFLNGGRERAHCEQCRSRRLLS